MKFSSACIGSAFIWNSNIREILTNRAVIPAARGGTLMFFGGSWASLVQTQLRSSKRPSTSGGACEHPAAQPFAAADGFAVR
jgi:hypothetical protein